MQLAAPLRLRARAMVIIAMALALVFGTLSAPALAGDDLESARASALETVNYKINSLKEYREGAKTDRAWAIYSEGIEELGGNKARILEEDNVEEIYALKERAKAVWAETKELAEDADRDRDPLAEAREAALNKINSKLEFFRGKARETDNPDHHEIYEWAIRELEKLKERALESESADELWELKAQAHEIYEVAMHRIEKEGGDEEDDNDEADRRKEEEEKRRREREKAEAALREARAETLQLLEKKIRLMTAASQSAGHHQMSETVDFR